MFKKVLVLCALMISLATVNSYSQTNSNKAGSVALTTRLDSVAYCIGYQIGKNLLGDSLMINTDILRSAMNDVLSGKQPMIAETQVVEIIQSLNADMQKKQQEKQKMVGAGNAHASAKFLEENKKKEGVKVTPSGLQYKVVKEGTGKQPKATDGVKVHYEGKLIDGKVFDSSIQRGEPIEFNLSGVIKGWTEGVQLMKEGGKIVLYVPADLAYGEQGAGQVIGPNSALIFEVELLEVKPPTATPDTPAHGK